MQGTLTRLMSALKRLWNRNSEPQDPYAYSHVRAPSGPGPRGRAAAVALEEPPEAWLRWTNAFGRRVK